MAEIEAGPEANALVAERVMKWERKLLAGRFYWFGPYDGRRHIRFDYRNAKIGDDVPLAFAEPTDPERWAPSIDIAAAFQVVEKMQADGFDFMLECEHADGNGWEAEFFEPDNLTASTQKRADTAPLAICKAALQAVGYSPVEREAAST